MTKREITTTIKGSRLGIVWLILSPLSMMALYTIVFGTLFKGSFDEQLDSNPWHYAIGIYMGLSVINFINEIITRSGSLIACNENLVKRVVFPLEIFPPILTLAIGFKLALDMIIWGIFLIFLNITPHLSALWAVPAVIFILFLLGLGISLILCSICVYLKDIQHTTPTITQILFWTSGVFFSLSKAAQIPSIWWFIKWNPILHLIDILRQCVIWHQSPEPFLLVYPLLFAVATYLLGSTIYVKLKKGFADLI